MNQDLDKALREAQAKFNAEADRFSDKADKAQNASVVWLKKYGLIVAFVLVAGMALGRGLGAV